MIKIEEIDDGATIVAKLPFSRLDAAVAEETKSELIARIDRGRTQVVVDLADVEFIDSSGLGMLVSVLKRLNDKRCLALCNLQGVVQSMLKLSHMDRVFTVYGSRDEAVAAISKSLARDPA